VNINIKFFFRNIVAMVTKMVSKMKKYLKKYKNIWRKWL